jgi:hypothetical protein
VRRMLSSLGRSMRAELARNRSGILISGMESRRVGARASQDRGQGNREL